LNLAASLRDEGKLPAAETLLQSLLKQKPADEGPALLLMRLYAEDLRQPERAYALLRKFARQPHVSSAHVDYARHSIPEWANAGRSAANQPAAPIESASVGRAAAEPTGPAQPAPFDLAEVDQLLAAGSLGSAVELLEAQIKIQPTDWKLQLKLAEVYAVHCHDVVRAQKTIGRLEQNTAFTADHVTMVRAKLEEWQAGAKRRP
jgi:tetratricopeptide (TPR) repeat protein